MAPEPASPRETWASRRFSGLPPAFWLLFGGVGVARLAFFVIPFRTYYLAHERHLTGVQASLVMVAFGLGWALSQPIGGWCADRLGRRAVIIASAWASAAAFVAFGSARTLPLLAFTGMLAGLSFDAYRPAVQALMTDVVHASHQARALALLYLTMNLGRGAACVLGGLLAEHSFWAMFVINATVNIGFGIAVRLVIGDPVRQTMAKTGRAGMWAALADRRLRAFTLITFAFYSIHMQSVITLPIVIDSAGATPLVFGLLLALDPLAVAVVQLLLQHWINRTSALAVCAAGVATVGIGLAITGMGTSAAWFAATIPIWVAGEVAFLTPAAGIIASIAPDHMRGIYFGIWGCCQGAAAVAAPLLASAFIALGGTTTLWIAGAIAGLATAASCLRLRTRPVPAPS
jgi:MFS family permease